MTDKRQPELIPALWGIWLPGPKCWWQSVTMPVIYAALGRHDAQRAVSGWRASEYEIHPLTPAAAEADAKEGVK